MREAMRSSASSQLIRRNPACPRCRTMGYGRRPSARSSSLRLPRKPERSSKAFVFRAGMVFSRRSRSLRLHRWTPRSVQSVIPAVPSEHPSQTPCCKIRQAKGS